MIEKQRGEEEGEADVRGGCSLDQIPERIHSLQHEPKDLEQDFSIHLFRSSPSSRWAYGDNRLEVGYDGNGRVRRISFRGKRRAGKSWKRECVRLFFLDPSQVNKNNDDALTKIIRIRIEGEKEAREPKDKL